MKRPVVLSIAGSDPSGGAGIQADLKTMTALGCYGMTVITAITVQNTLGVTRSEPLTAKLTAAQLDAVFSDIQPDAVKIGMVSSAELIQVIAQKLQEYHAQNIVLDPVMISTSGHTLLEAAATDALLHTLLPLASLSTPNLPEGAALLGRPIHNKADMEQAAAALFAVTGRPVLLKGGQLKDCADDLLFTKAQMVWFPGRQLPTKNTHGTGCTLSSAIACGLARGLALTDAVREAKAYLFGALSSGLELGHGCGPVDHCFSIKRNHKKGEFLS